MLFCICYSNFTNSLNIKPTLRNGSPMLSM